MRSRLPTAQLRRRLVASSTRRRRLRRTRLMLSGPRGWTTAASGHLRAVATSRGLFGGQPVWRKVAIGMYAWSFLRRAITRQPDELGTARLAPGQSLLITTALPRTRRRRTDTATR